MIKLIIMCLTLVSILIIESESKSNSLIEEKFFTCLKYVIDNEKKKDKNSTSKHLWFENKMEAEKDLKIVNGTLADIIHFPYMSYVGYCRAETLIALHCGGNIITEYHILTAAHCCVKKKKPYYEERKSKYFTIKVGSSSSKKNKGGKYLEVTEIHIHPDYRLLKTNGRDLAVLKAAEKFPMSKTVATIPVATPELSNQLEIMENSRTECVIAGWGRTISNETNPDHLRSAILPLIPIDQCILVGRLYRFRIKQKLHLCTFSSYKSPCFGDSGGGLVCKSKDGVRRIWGVTSFVCTENCTGQLQPTYYARVDNADSFLNEFLVTKSSRSAATLHQAVLKLLFPLVLQVSSSSLR